MPAVSRPALSSVTRRTLINVFAWDRSINFCKLRTLARSPTFDAVKIRCRKRRTSFAASRQSIAFHSGTPSSGPFTTHHRPRPTPPPIPSWRPTCPSVLVSLSAQSPQAHLAHVSTLSGPGTARIRPVIRERQRRSRPCVPGFLSSFDAPAFASWAILSPLGDPLPSRSAHRTTTNVTGIQRDCHVPHERDTTGVGAPYIPRHGGVPWPRLGPSTSACRIPAACPTTPLTHHICKAHHHGTSSGIYQCSPVQSSPSPVASGCNGRPW